MGVLDRLRRWLGRADQATAEVEFAAMEGVHRAEDAVDEATGGRFYDALERADEEAGELLERLHLDEEDEDAEASGEEPAPGGRQAPAP
jgi:hypothetical protein